MYQKMKKAILASLCSAFVVPGLGQILNHEIKKGLLILSAVFVIFVGGCVKLAFIITSIMANNSSLGEDTQGMLKAIETENLGFLWILVALFALVWVYSVIDAFLSGRRLEEENRHEILSDR
jgi:O-antigen/teichoic acid export membrane protein